MTTTPFKTGLQQYIEQAGATIEVAGKRFEVSNFTDNRDIDLTLASFKSTRVTYDGMRLPKARVIGAPGAEVWEVFTSSGKKVAAFAIHEGRLRALA
ncbi:MAG: hypothetical protein K8I30_02635 [Anaerolineae bacterium]|jgi:hypothetical protein|nr:hypothetical protein [Anaerolineae bacterium]GIK44917.1 MAG: hypothetical protein BroJett012_08200 [Betaproteobacteria bacterium]